MSRDATSTRGGARKGAGRPPMDAGERKEHTIKVRVTEEDAAELVAWAEREGRPLSEMLAERGLRAARR